MIFPDSSEFKRTECSVCGIPYYLPKSYLEARYAQRNGSKPEDRSWRCPNGHSQTYTESEFDQVRRERDRLKQDNARLEDNARAAERGREAAERRYTQALKRVGAGTCPCCNRSFSALAEHMRQVHPEHAPKGQIAKAHLLESWWTPARSARAFEMRSQKITVEKIAVELGTEKAAVARHLRQGRASA